jgi:hypothetical protein
MTTEKDLQGFKNLEGLAHLAANVLRYFFDSVASTNLQIYFSGMYVPITRPHPK